MKDIITGVQGTYQIEYTVQKSRFITTIQEVHSEDCANNFIDTIKKKYWEASHNCSAYQLGPSGEQQKSNDDGEPSGTAGRPMLDVLKKSKITDTAVVVTRYFGGIKLGSGGLIRAYSHAVALGLTGSVIADYIPHQQALTSFAYPFIHAVEQLAKGQQVILAERTFSHIVNFSLLIPLTILPDFTLQLTNLTQGTAILTLQKQLTIPIVRK